MAIIVAGARAASGDLVISGDAIRDLGFDGAATRDLPGPMGGSSIHLGRVGRVGRAARSSPAPEPSGDQPTDDSDTA